MTNELIVLAFTAASVGIIHTVLGPDHYIPFIAMSKAANWSRMKTIIVTTACGIGHVLSSVIIGIIGLGFGIAINKIEWFESSRGEIASWLLISFGLLYTAWGIKRLIKHKPHTHIHFHENGEEHNHKHTHSESHVHVHENKQKKLTPWILFVIFIFGPCEAFIPIIMYPAAMQSVWGILLVTIIFAVFTVGTMLLIVTLSLYGISRINIGKLERYSHAIAGGIILLCGIMIKIFDL